MQRDPQASRRPAPLWDVLVVDDEAVVRDGVARILGGESLRVATAKDAASALEHPALAVCRLVLCDLVMPALSGLEFVTRLKVRRPGMPVVLMTGYATAEQEDLARCSGAAGFLAKPFDEAELLAAVCAALEPENTATEETRP